MNAKNYLNTLGNTVTEWDTSTIARMAQAQGYHFSAEELETAADELWGNLSEDQLRDVAGGGSVAPSTDGPVTVDLSKAGQSSGDGTWSPPPGDVSGNSCFFTKR
jgi:hypothetical protein